MRRLLLFALPLLACQADRDAEVHIARIENELLPRILIQGEPAVTATLEERMVHHKVPGVSIAVINHGEVEWARGYGMADVEQARPVTTQTLFQAASISKPVAATAALRLVEEGVLVLDEDVNRKLESWHVPANQYTAAEPVTLRRLVTHTAGLTVHGFPGYASDERVPTTIEVLDGAGNTDPIRADTTPGSMWRYSGGGYTVMQLLLADVTGKPFPLVLRERVLDPAGMVESTYEQPLPEDRRGMEATGYRDDGSEVKGKWHTYPEMAAAGLWTTPSDLARFAIAIQRAYAGESSGVLAPEMAQQMLEPGMNGWGLGPAIGGDGKYFGHGGANEGFRCRFVAFIKGGQGAAIMTNSDNGGALVEEILRTIADEYDWPVLRPVEKVVAEVDPALYDELAGPYEFPGLGIITLEVVDGRLWARQVAMFLADVPGEPREELLPESETEFFSRDEGTRVTFIRENGRVTALEVSGRRAERVK